MRRIYFFSFILIAFLFNNCTTEEDLDETLLHGKWQGADWLIEGKSANLDVKSIAFEFDQDANYSAKYAAQLEKGSYRLSGRKLYTTAEGDQEKVVKIIYLSTDSLKMDMNRAGRNEVMVLVKQ